MDYNETINSPSNKKGKAKIAIVILCIIIVMLLAIILILLLGNDKKNKNTNTNKEQQQNKNNNEEKEPTPPANLDFELIDINIKKINTEKNYFFKLAKKYNSNLDQYDDGYTYALYDLKKQKLITDFSLKNITCGNTCSSNPNEIGCIEKNIKSYIINTNNKDYLYVTYRVNVCGGIDNNHIIYDISNDSIISTDHGENEEAGTIGYGGTEEIETIGNDIVIRLQYAGDDTCGGWENKNAFCGYNGFMFSKNGKFEKIDSVDSFKYNKMYAFINEKDNNRFSLSMYNEKAEPLYKIENGIAYNDEYIVTYDENGMIVNSLNNKKIGTIEFEKYTKGKYLFNPDLTLENKKLVIEYKLNNDLSEVKQKLYFELP